MAETRLADKEARRRAATDFDRNLVVLAGAGTGKTSLLVERVLNAVGSGVAEMQQVGAITFTEKAAGELRERLALGLDRLRALARGEIEPDGKEEAGRAFEYLKGRPEFSAEKTATLALRAMEQLDGGTVTTIHGFCSELLRAHPVEAGVDPGFAVDSGAWTDLLLDSTWASFVNRELGADAPRPELWRALLARVPFESIAQVARESSGFGIPAALLRPPWPGSSAPGVLERIGGTLATEIDQLLEAQTGLSAVPLRYFQNAWNALTAMEREGLTGFRNFLVKNPGFRQDVENKKTISINKKLEEDLKETAKRLKDDTRRLLHLLWNADDELPRSVLEATLPFTEEFREQYLRRGFVSFDGLLSLARDLLRDHPAVRTRLKRRYRLLLVDEFQDTDPLQYEIVLFLAEVDDETAGEPYDARLAPGRLFVVGDAKQSIYRFRGADYTAYRRAVDRIVDAGGAELNLVSNFRSLPEVAAPINRLFESNSGCWQETEHQPEYVPIVPAREPAGEPPRVELWSARLPPDGSSASEGREAEARLIAEAIEGWVREERHPYREITILFRALTSLNVYLRALRDRGIPFVVDGGRDFLERPEVAQLMATFGTIAQPADQAALLAFLRSPAGAVTDVELAAFAAEGGDWSWNDTVDPAQFPGIARCFQLLRALERETRALTADAAVRRILDRTLMLPLGAAAFEGAQRVANLQKLTAAAGELAKDGRLSLEEVVCALKEGNLEQVKTDRPLADDAADAVRICTMHRMKGLENDCVIVPDLARGRGSGHSPPAVASTTLPDGSPALGITIAGKSNSPRVWYDLEDARHGDSEEVRVLYVALTRAKERLVLLARRGHATAAWIEALKPWGYDVKNPPPDGEIIAGGEVLHRLLDPPGRPRHKPVESREEAPQAVLAYQAAVEALRGSAQAPFNAPSSAGHEEDPSREPPEGRGRDRPLGLAAGRVLHRLLELWDGEDENVLDEEIGRLAREEAHRPGLDATSVEAESKRIVEKFLTGELSRRFRTRAKVGREIPLLMRRDPGGQYRGSIDLLYEDDDGSLVVADYKTDDESRPEELLRRYGEQLRIYAEAAMLALGLEAAPRAELWMLRSGERIVID